MKKFFAVAAQVGGFLRLANLVFLLMLVFTRTWGGEKYLVSRMFKFMLDDNQLEKRRETERRAESLASSGRSGSFYESITGAFR